MAQTYLIRGARQLVTLRGPSEPRRGSQLADLSIITDGALLIRDGIIVEVGQSRRVENLSAARNAQEINATGRVVMPAFVDSAVSLVFAHSPIDKSDARMYSGTPVDGARQRQDILDATRALRLISAKRLGMRASSVLASMARHGTGSAGVVSGFGLDTTGELKSLRVAKSLNGVPLDLFSCYFGGNTIPEEFEPDPQAYIERVATPMFSTVKRRALARFAAIRCGAGGFDTRSTDAYLAAATEAGLNVSVHSQQFAPDDSAHVALKHGALRLLHLEHLARTDIEPIARSHTIAVLTPASTFHMGLTRFAPARELIDRGAAVALATGFNPDGCPTFSMPFVLTLACRYLGLSAAEAISAATINAAHAHQQGARIGSLEAGKQADLIVLNARDYRELPQQTGVNLVHSVMKKGKLLPL